MIEPVQSDDVFLADVVRARALPGLHIWWLGQSGFLISTAERSVLIDPYLSDSLTAKYAGTNKPHVRMTRRVIDPSRLDFLSLATSSHNHTDHLDADTLKPILQVNPGLPLLVPEANRDFVAQRLGIDPSRPIGIDDGQTVKVEDIEISAVAAAHDTVERDAAGRCRFLGYVFQIGRWSIYHSGDTVRYDDMVDRLSRFSIDVALLPINGRASERQVAGNLSGAEAAQLARDIYARLVIPCHYELFEFNTTSPDGFVAECKRLGQPYRVLRTGERFTVV